MTDGYTHTCGLIGNPVEHTLSPVIHNYLAQQLNENLVYVPFHVSGGLLEDAVKGAYALNLLGCNVTVPYKSQVIPFLTALDPLAERIGAVNTLVRTMDGFKGYNTDMPGLYRAMTEDNVVLEQEQVIILGAGGVARAVAFLMAEKKAKRVVILNRTLEKAQEIATEVNRCQQHVKIEAMALKQYLELAGNGKYLVIQATSVGMHPHEEKTIIEDDAFYELVHSGYDLIFNPSQTRFLKLVRDHGGRAFNGAKMLLYQGIIAYELWTGCEVGSELSGKTYEQLLNAMKTPTEMK